MKIDRLERPQPFRAPRWAKTDLDLWEVFWNRDHTDAAMRALQRLDAKIEAARLRALERERAA